MEIGQIIKKRREELSMSQEELAILVGYKSRSSINKIEVDGRGLPQSKIVAIAKALETTPAYLMGWEDKDTEVVSRDEKHKEGPSTISKTWLSKHVVPGMPQDKFIEAELDCLVSNYIHLSIEHRKRLISYSQKILELYKDEEMLKSETLSEHLKNVPKTPEELERKYLPANNDSTEKNIG